MKKNFETFYSEINDSELNILWQNAKKEKNRAKIITLFCIIIIDILIIFFLKDSVLPKIFSTVKIHMPSIGYLFPLFFLLVFFLIIDTIVYLIINVFFSKNTSKYNSKYKEKIIDSLLENFFSEVDYIPKKSMPKQVYNEGEYEMYDNFYSDDYMEAYIMDKYKIIMAEVETEEERRVENYSGNYEPDSFHSDGNNYETQEITLFSGLFAKIDIQKSINCELKIGDNGILKNNKLNMDSQEFEKYFDVTATNKIIGMQILTHDIMELLLNFRNRLREKFDIFIKNNIMYIRFHVGSMFEAKLNNKEVIDKKILQDYFDILEFVELLSRNMIEVIEQTQI